MSLLLVYGKYLFLIGLVWLWSTLIMEMSSRRSALTRNERLTSKKRRFGTFSFK